MVLGERTIKEKLKGQGSVCLDKECCRIYDFAPPTPPPETAKTLLLRKNSVLPYCSVHSLTSADKRINHIFVTR